MRVFMLGASGTIGRATVRALVQAGHEVVCLLRPGAGREDPSASARAYDGAEVRWGQPLDAASVRRDGLRGERFDAWVSCLASRTGAPRDAWAIDFEAHVHALDACREAGVQHVVLLSAMCVQRPRLAFQEAKLAFERRLIESGLNYSIVRPTAFFKSLSGQLNRVRQGKPFLIFEDGCLTACKPIANEDLAAYLAGCLMDPARHRAILPIGGPGPALTPREQGELLFEALGRPVRFRAVPIAWMVQIVRLLSWAGRWWPAAADKAELARIGLYYATESMLVLDSSTGQYRADLTPEFGTRTLREHYRALARGDVGDERGDHAVF